MAKRNPKILYHYCSLSTFLSIINNRSIWLSDIGKSNDSLELKWIKDRCRYYTLKAWVDYVKSVDKNGNLEKVDFKEFDHLQDQLDNLYNYESDKCWVFCLSEKQDDLGQWRGYADDGFGISIGFNSSFFKAIMKQGSVEFTDKRSVVFDSVCYNEKETEKLFYKTCGLSLITPQMSSKEVLDKLRYAVAASLLVAPFFKNEKFAEEKEWRLVLGTSTSELMAGKTPKTGFAQLFPKNEIQYDFSVRNNNLVSHIAFVDNNIKNYITEIWIGPKCKSSVVDVKLFLISAGLIKSFDDDSIRIYYSQASYR